MIQQDYHPIGTLAIAVAVATTEVNGVVTALRIYVRHQGVAASPTTLITANSLEHEVVSRAGLTEDTLLSNYVLERTDVFGDVYEYVLTADVS